MWINGYARRAVASPSRVPDHTASSDARLQIDRMRKSTKWLLLGGSAGTMAALAAAYGTAARPWHSRWGATREELSQPMPFDDLIHRPNYVTTRAVTVDASPDVVWPLLRDLRPLPTGTLI